MILDTYDAGLLGDGGGGDVDWWQNYLRAELAAAHDFYQSQVDGALEPFFDRFPLDSEDPFPVVARTGDVVLARMVPQDDLASLLK